MSEIMKRCNIWLPSELYDRVELMKQTFGYRSVTEVLIELIERGYLQKLGGEKRAISKIIE